MKKDKRERSGGINVGGNITAGGDVVGRDKTTINLTGGTSIENQFNVIRKKVDSRRDDVNVDKDELHTLVDKIENEVKKGKKANVSKVERWLVFLASMAGDIFEVTVATLTNPVNGIARTIQLIAQKVEKEYQG